MANELNIQLDPFNDSGLTLIAKAFNSDGTQLGSDVAMTEIGSRAYYTANFSLAAVSDGAYLISFETTNKFYGSGILYVKDNTEINVNDLETETLAASRETNIIAAVPSVANIADGVWDEPYTQHTTSGTFGKLMDILRKANRAIEGEVTGTPTTTSFTTNITGYVTDAFNSEIMVFVSGTINGEARPILSFDNTTSGTFNFEEAWTQAPSAGDEFIILPYHVHAISEIQAGLAKTTELNATETAILAAISALNDLDQQEVAEAVWDYLQSSTTVSASMKEAIQKILINANLIPAIV